MNKITCKLILSIFFGIILIGCNSGTETKDHEKLVEQLVYEWNNANNSKDIGKLSELYDNTVIFYQSSFEKNDCLDKKLQYFKNHSDFYQQIYGDIKIRHLSDVETQCTFVKRVTIGGKTTDYPSYLTFLKVGDNWKITTEGDMTTDKNLTKSKRKTKNIKKLIEDSNDDEYIEEIPEIASKATASEEAIGMPKNLVEGDFDGDGIEEYVWLEKPDFPDSGVDSEESAGMNECVGDCNCVLRFSNENIPSILVKSCIGGVPVNEGDLDGNGTDEIGLLPEWWTSCWMVYNVYTYKDYTWHYLVKPFSTHCDQWDAKVDAIQKSAKYPGYVIIRYMDMEAEDFKVKEKLIKVN